MNRDVFLSLLALDAYNRGYGQNVLTREDDSVSGQNELARQFGNATIVGQNMSQGAQAAGFYAMAYNWSGGRVISCRATSAALCH